MAQGIYDVLNELAKDLAVPVATPEYEIMLVLLDTGGLGPDQLCRISSLSRSGFFHAIDRLKYWRFLTSRIDPLDRRCKIYSLYPLTAEMLVSNLRLYRDPTVTFARLIMRRVDGAGRPAELPRGKPDAPGLALADDGLRLAHFSCEFQILLYLYLAPGAAPGEIGSAITASRTKFHATLRDLVAQGLVIQSEDGADKRRKCCTITDHARHAIARARLNVLAWLDRLDHGEDAVQQAS